MQENKFKWYIANKKYVNYLRKFDSKVEKIEYDNKLKPYIGIVIKINDFNYYVPVSSPKEKHYNMKEDMDFIKIMQKNKIIGVLNLNNMIPILDKYILKLKYVDIEKYRKFDSQIEKRKYISFLNLELYLINQKAAKIRKAALKLYKEKINNPKSKISQRCCNFKLLEEISKNYNI